jgi:hypothetical protein
MTLKTQLKIECEITCQTEKYVFIVHHNFIVGGTLTRDDNITTATQRISLRLFTNVCMYEVCRRLFDFEKKNHE